MAEEITFKSAGTLATDDKYSGTVESVPIGIKTPLQFGLVKSGIFDMNFEYADQINDNLKNLIMTNYGDRLGLYKFGANLRQLVSERTSRDGASFTGLTVSVKDVELDSSPSSAVTVTRIEPL